MRHIRESCQALSVGTAPVQPKRATCKNIRVMIRGATRTTKSGRVSTFPPRANVGHPYASLAQKKFPRPIRDKLARLLEANFGVSRGQPKPSLGTGSTIYRSNIKNHYVPV